VSTERRTENFRDITV